jgi:ribonucleoside-diphosphate reductase alpha chain
MIKVKKRNGTIVDFNKDKIVNAVNKALKAAKIEDNKISKDVALSIYEGIDKELVSIDEIHGRVETELMEKGFSDAARSYILYRYKKKEKFIKDRQEKRKLLNIEGQLDPVSEKFSLNSLRVLESRYLIKDENMKVIETPTQLFERIATHVGCANIMYDERVFDKDGDHEANTDTISGIVTFNRDYYVREENEYNEMNLSIGKYRLNGYNLKQLERLYAKLSNENKMKVPLDKILEMIKNGEFDKYEKTIKSYFDLMVSQKFMPNTPTIANAGNKLGQLSACFVIDMEDNIESIMDTAKNMAIIFKSGGGVGINYAKLREDGATISTTSGTSSGPLSFMNIINTVTDTVKQGGKRRGANMGSMNSSHPDILKFIHAKETPGILENFNVSVGIDAKFWECYKENKPYELVSPSTGKVKATVNPRDLMKEISRSAWNSSEPGVLLFDNANKYNVMQGLKGELNSTNPCGEQYLYPYESCNLGSINLTKFVKNKLFDFDSFGQVIDNCIDFLDSVIDVNKYPVNEIDNESWRTRRIGLGAMGVADMLYMLEIPYNSYESYTLQEQIAQFLTYRSLLRSVKLAKARGSFPYFERTECKYGKVDVAGIWEGGITAKPPVADWQELQEQIVKYGLRNVNVDMIAPTGSISMIADCSSGIEPVFALAFEKKVAVGNFYYVNQYLEAYLKKYNIDYDEELLKTIAKSGSCQNVDLPDEVKKIFITSMDIHGIDHVIAQAVWQRWMTNAVSKTCNLPNNVTPEDIENIYLFAHEMGLKGITIYRDGSRQTQVLYTENMENKQLNASEYARNIYQQKMIKGLDGMVIKAKMMNKEVTPTVEGFFTQTIENKPLRYKTSDTADCPKCGKPMIKYDGCKKCLECNESLC